MLRSLAWPALLVVLVSVAGPAAAINVTIDYTYDTSDFFGAGNPDGAAAGADARAALEAAASFYSGILDDTFTGGSIPDRVNSSFQPGAYFEWQVRFSNPSTGATEVLTDLTNAVDEFKIFVGARSIGGSTLGFGGPGGFQFGPFNASGELDGTVLFTSEDIAQVNAGTAEFEAGFVDRGETSGFARWGGAVTFDNDGSTNWHYDLGSSPAFNESDFYSVALHELGHTLGFGVTNEWQAFVQQQGNSLIFNGPAAVAEFGGNVPLENDAGHWESGTTSTVFGTDTSQETLLDPSLLSGTRTELTSLDAAALADLGWEITEPDPPVTLVGDYNADLLVDSADYAIWRNTAGSGQVIGNYVSWRANFGATGAAVAAVGVPEPGALALLLVGAAITGIRRRG